MHKFDDKDLGTVLESGQGLPWDLPVDGFEGVSGPVVPFHEFLAKLRAASCVSESVGESPCDSFSPLIVRLAFEAGINCTSLDGAE